MASAEPTRLFTRRRVLRTLVGGAAAGAVSGAGLLTWTLGIEPHLYEVVERPMPLAGLPAALVGKRLVQLSDFHAGRTSVDYLAGACAHVNALRPDLVVLTGDFIDHDSPASTADLPRMLGALHLPPLGAFACLGNHDYGARWSKVEVANRVVKAINGAGIRLLSNEAVDVAGLTIAGIDDLWSPHYNPWAVMPRVDGSRDAVVLVHNPDACDFDHWFNFRGWFLAGHTHGGQCKPPFLPPPLLPVENRRYVAGEYDVGTNRRLYINRGIGHSLRARFNCRPEITVFTLSRAA